MVSKRKKPREVLQIEGEPHIECPECNVVKPFSDFYKASRSPLGIQHKCKECDNGRRVVNKRKAVADNPEYYRDRQYQMRYGLSLEDVTQMWEDQGRRCKACSTFVEFKSHGKDKACVDHDHETGEVRGILCNQCNLALGAVEDNKEILSALIDYLP